MLFILHAKLRLQDVRRHSFIARLADAAGVIYVVYRLLRRLSVEGLDYDGAAVYAC